LEHIISASYIGGGVYTPDTTARSVDGLLLQSIDEVLSDLLGRRAREAIYDHLERNHSLARSEIPKHITKFLELLDETFGKGGRTIWKLIVRRMYEKLEWKFYDNPGYEFIDYMEEIRVKVAKSLMDHAKSCSRAS
jgi:hypothetical protein